MNPAGFSTLLGGIAGFVCAFQRESGVTTLRCQACVLGPYRLTRLKPDALHFNRRQIAQSLRPLTG